MRRWLGLGIVGRASKPVSVFVLLVAIIVGPWAGSPGMAVGAVDPGSATLLVDVPSSLDPAAEGDSASAAVSAQLFEGLTALDPTLAVRPALAASWQVLDAGRRVVFTLRPDLTFSDGTPLGAQDVVRSWLRLIAPGSPSPLASLLSDVVGATDYLSGTSTAPSAVGLHASGQTVEVDLIRPNSDLPAMVASPSFAIVPTGVSGNGAGLDPGSGFVASGAYRLTARTSSELTLTANPQYWAGRPAIGTVHLKTDIGGQSPVDAFAARTLDYTPVDPSDATWIRYDATLGPLLREDPSLSVTYYGFDVHRAPFDDVRVRRAFAEAVDWKRLVGLVAGDAAQPATSMVPPGIPGRSDQDLAPAYDTTAAQADLAAAGYSGGRGFPEITLVTDGAPYDAAVAADLERVLGVRISLEVMESTAYFERLATDPPAFWALGWVADYPGPNDFLGLLLGTGSTDNYGHWSSEAFDSSIAEAASAADPAAVRAAYAKAEAVVQHDDPVVPVAYPTQYALARQGLLGAVDNGLGIIRLAGLAWSSP